MPSQILLSSELRRSDVVHCHGLAVYLTADPQISKAHAIGENGPCYFMRGVVLNREDVSSDSVPYSFTADKASPTGHAWTVQANDLIGWTVDRS